MGIFLGHATLLRGPGEECGACGTGSMQPTGKLGLWACKNLFDFLFLISSGLDIVFIEHSSGAMYICNRVIAEVRVRACDTTRQVSCRSPCL